MIWLFERCTDQEVNYFSYQKPELLFSARLLVMIAAIVATLVLACRIKCADCPKIVIVIWVLIDSAAVLNFFSNWYWLNGVNFSQQGILRQWTYYCSVILNLYFHYIFSI